MAVCLTSRGGLRVIVVSLLFLCSSSYSYAVYLAMLSCVSIFLNLSGLPSVFTFLPRVCSVLRSFL